MTDKNVDNPLFVHPARIFASLWVELPQDQHVADLEVSVVRAKLEVLASLPHIGELGVNGFEFMDCHLAFSLACFISCGISVSMNSIDWRTSLFRL